MESAHSFANNAQGETLPEMRELQRPIGLDGTVEIGNAKPIVRNQLVAMTEQ